MWVRTNQGSGTGNRFVRYTLRGSKLTYAQGVVGVAHLERLGRQPARGRDVDRARRHRLQRRRRAVLPGRALRAAAVHRHAVTRQTAWPGGHTVRVPARDRLDEYKRKRDPQRTPEPAGDGGADGGAGRQPLRRPGAPRHPPALGPAPRARRCRRLVGDPQRDPRGPEGEPPRRAHGGPSARVPRVRGRHPEGRVRRRHDAHLGPRHVRDAQVRRRQGRDHLPRRAPARPLRPVSPEEAQGRAAGQGLDDPPHGSRRGSDPRADARAARADARQAEPGGPAARRRPLGLRDQVGRRARAGLLRAGADPLREPQPQRHHELLSRAQGAQPGAELAPRDPRRRDRRLRRERPAVVRAPAGPDAHRLRGARRGGG